MTRSVRMCVGALGAYLLGLGAGLVVTGAAGHRPEPEPRTPTWWAQELELSPQQEEQVASVWVAYHRTDQRLTERWRMLEQRRNQAIHALLPTASPAQLARIGDQ